jgi:hypothetical protein
MSPAGQLLQFAAGAADTSSDSVRHMYFIGAGLFLFVAILVVFVYFQQRKRRR